MTLLTPSELHPRVQNLGVSKLVSEIHNKSWPLLTKRRLIHRDNFYKINNKSLDIHFYNKNSSAQNFQELKAKCNKIKPGRAEIKGVFIFLYTSSNESQKSQKL